MSKPTDRKAAKIQDDARRKKIMRAAENVAALGMLLVCAGLMIPLFNLTDPHALAPFKWIYSFGTLLFVAARATGSMDRSGPVRLRRLRRMEFWAGVCFMTGAAFWFYQEQHLGANAGPLALIRNTILFTLAGAVIQIIASWLIYAREKKLRGEHSSSTDAEKKQ